MGRRDDLLVCRLAELEGCMDMNISSAKKKATVNGWHHVPKHRVQKCDQYHKAVRYMHTELRRRSKVWNSFEIHRDIDIDKFSIEVWVPGGLKIPSCLPLDSGHPWIVASP